MISAVWSSDFERYLQAERDMVKHCFAFNHVKFGRYMTYQHVLQRTMLHNNHPAIDELKTRGFRCNLSGGKISSINGDLATEMFNGETKCLKFSVIQIIV